MGIEHDTVFPQDQYRDQELVQRDPELLAQVLQHVLVGLMKKDEEIDLLHADPGKRQQIFHTFGDVL